MERRSHQGYLQPANLLSLKCRDTLSNYNCGEIFILSLTKMKHFFQKLLWHGASTRESKCSVQSQELLISFISGRSLMWSDRERENIPSLLKYKLSRFQFCCCTTHTGDQPGKSEEERTEPNACIQCSCILKAYWKDCYLRWLSGELLMNFNYEGGRILKNNAACVLALSTA